VYKRQEPVGNPVALFKTRLVEEFVMFDVIVVGLAAPLYSRRPMY